MQSFWKELNLTKTLLPQLLLVLREGGRGNAASIFPNLLPLLSRLPVDQIEDRTTFYETFFKHLLLGLAKVQIQSEANAILQAYGECLKYVLYSQTVFEEEAKKISFFSLINENQIKGLLSDSLTSKSPLVPSALLPVISDLFRSFQKTPSLQDILITGVCSVIEQLFEKHEDTTLLFPRTTRLFSAMAGAKQPGLKKRVGFAANCSKRTNEITLTDTQEITDDRLKRLMGYLLTKSISQMSLKENGQWLVLACDIISLDKNLSILKSILDIEDGADTPQIFFGRYLQSWMNESASIAKEHDEEDDAFVKIFFLLSQATANRKQFLENISSITSNLILQRIFTYVANNYRGDKELAAWIISESFTSVVLLLTDKLLHNIIVNSDNSTDTLWEIIRICFSIELSNQVCLEQVLQKFTGALKALKEGNATGQQVIDFSCDLIGNLFDFYKPWSSLAVAGDLLTVLFGLSCKISDKQDKLQQSWLKGLKQFLVNESEFDCSEGLLGSLISLANSLVLSLNDMPTAELLSNNISLLIEAVITTAFEAGVTNDIVGLLAKSLLLSPEQLRTMIDKYPTDAYLSHWIDGQLLPHHQSSCLYLPIIFDSVSTELYVMFTNATICEKLAGFARVKDIPLPEIILKQQSYALTTLGYTKLISHYNNDQRITKIGQKISGSFVEILDLIKSNEFIVNELTKLSRTNYLSSFGLRTYLNISEQGLTIDFDSQSITKAELVFLQENAGRISSVSRNELMQTTLNSFLCLDNYSSEKSVTCLQVLLACLKSSEISTIYEPFLQPLLEVFDGLKESRDDILFYSSSYDSSNVTNVQFTSVVIELFGLAVDHYFVNLLQSQKYVDFILCSLTSWTMSICQHRSLIVSELHLLVLASRVFRLLTKVSAKLNLDANLEMIAREWEGFHAKKITAALIDLLVTFANRDKQFLVHEKAMLCCLGEALKTLRIQDMDSTPHSFEAQPPLDKKQRPESADLPKTVVLQLPNSELQLLSSLSPLVLNENRFLSITSSSMLTKLMPLFAKGLLVPEISAEQDETFLAPPLPLLATLEESGHLVDEMLADHSVGDFCYIEPASDCHVVILAYLMNWIHLIELFANLDTELRACFASFLREAGFLFKLFDNLFKLMPYSAEDQEHAHVPLNDMFKQEVELHLDAEPSSNELQHLACRVYYAALRKMPASARQWWTNQDKRVTDHVNCFTSRYVSDLLCSQEIKSVQDADKSNFDNLIVKARPNAREVMASYSFEEMSIELCIKLAANHPLGHVAIESGRRIGVTSSQWRSWLLQMTTFLTHQNGSILDGLLLWKKNIDNRFAGLEECMICFYVLHGSTCQLPKLTCRNCKKRFHTACLVSSPLIFRELSGLNYLLVCFSTNGSALVRTQRAHSVEICLV